MIFRPPKKRLSNRIVLTLNHTKIYESTKIKYLGLLLDSRLSWKEHINALTKKTVDLLVGSTNPENIVQHLYSNPYIAVFSTHTCLMGFQSGDMPMMDTLKRLSRYRKRQLGQ